MRRALGLTHRLGFAALATLAVSWGPAAAQDRSPVLYAFDEALTGDDEQRLTWPVAIVAGGTDEIAVADGAGPSLWVFRDRGGAEGWLLEVSIDLPSMAYDLAANAGRYLISTRQPGQLLAVEAPSWELRELKLPARVAPGAVTYLSDGRILVHDLVGGRLLVLDRDLDVRTSIALRETVAALAPGPGGGFYATLPQSGEVRRYGANGEEVAILTIPGLEPAPAWPVGLIVESNGEIVVADRHGGRLVVLSAGGRPVGSGSRRGWEPGLLRFPADIAALSEGRVAVADQSNGRVQIFRRIEK